MITRQQIQAPVRKVGFGGLAIEPQDRAAVDAVLQSGWLGRGPQVRAFEEAFAAYTGAPYAIAVSSCTAALHLSLWAAGIGPGDEVITTPITYCATVNAIRLAGATPVLADIDPLTGNLHPQSAREKLTPRTRAIIPVHLAGRSCPMADLQQFADTHGLVVIEDCAHAIESLHAGRHCGTWGLSGCFSFYPTKSLTTGDGGMVITADPDFAARVRLMSTQGVRQDAWDRRAGGVAQYEVVAPGYKAGMNDLEAALGLSQMPRLDRNWQRRKRLAELYDGALDGLPLARPIPVEADDVHAHHLYQVLIDAETRDEVLSQLATAGVEARIHYPPIAKHTFYRNEYGWKPEDSPAADHWGRTTLSLPISSTMADDDVWYVAESLAQALRGV